MATIIEPHPRQKLAMSCPAGQIFFGGAAGGGKSFCSLLFVARGAKDWGKDFRAIMFRKTYPQLEEIEREAKRLFVPMGTRYNATKHNFIFPNGAELRLASLEKDRDVEKYQGQQFGLIVFDELANWPTDYCWEYMTSRNRSAAGVECQMLGTGNPGGPGNAWVKNKWIDGFKPDVMYKIPVYKDKGGEWKYITQCFVPSLLEDNPTLTENDPEYETRLMALPEHLRRALRFGDWDVYSGQVFGEWRRERHVVKPFALPASGWFKFYAMDWGFNKPYSVSKFAVNYDGKVIKYGEMYGCQKGEVNKGTKEASAIVAERVWQDAMEEGVADMVADPATWNKQDGYPAPADNFGKAGFSMIRAVNDRLPGLNTFHNFLQQKDENGEPMFQVFNTCYHTIRTMPMLLPDPRKPEDVDSSLEDHIYDSDRYGLMSSFVSSPQATMRRVHAMAVQPVKQQPYSVLKDW
jgi:hypothetical protein